MLWQNILKINITSTSDQILISLKLFICKNTFIKDEDLVYLWEGYEITTFLHVYFVPLLSGDESSFHFLQWHDPNYLHLTW